MIGTIKYSGAKLHEKGVILEIEGLQPNQYVFIFFLLFIANYFKIIEFLIRFKNVLFEISSTEEPGVFVVHAKFMGVTMEKVELVFQVSLILFKIFLIK
jgi:hypothetical protein